MVEKELFKSNINALFWEPTMYTMVDYIYMVLSLDQLNIDMWNKITFYGKKINI